MAIRPRDRCSHGLNAQSAISCRLFEAMAEDLRRWLYPLLLAVLLLPPMVQTSAQGEKQSQGALRGFQVNSQRLQQTLDKLSEFGRNPEGGVTRLGFSEADMAAREYVMGLMRQAGLAVRVDAAGNIFGRRPGTENLPVLLFGSHIDSVLHGGNFDGDVGSLGALEVMRALNEHKVATRHPLEMVVWSNEEGHHFGKGLFGSGAAAGVLGPGFSSDGTNREFLGRLVAPLRPGPSAV